MALEQRSLGNRDLTIFHIPGCSCFSHLPSLALCLSCEMDRPLVATLPLVCFYGLSAGDYGWWLASSLGLQHVQLELSSLSSDSSHYRKTIYGPNIIAVPVKSYLQLLVDEVG